MISTAFKLLTSKLAGPIGAAGCVVLAMMLLASTVGSKVKDHQIKTQVKQIAGLASDLQTCRGSRQRLEAGIAAGKATVAASEAEAAGRTGRGQKAVGVEQAGVAAANKRAAHIMSIKPGADRCSSADALILGSVG